MGVGRFFVSCQKIHFSHFLAHSLAIFDGISQGIGGVAVDDLLLDGRRNGKAGDGHQRGTDFFTDFDYASPMDDALLGSDVLVKGMLLLGGSIHNAITRNMARTLDNN